MNADEAAAAEKDAMIVMLPTDYVLGMWYVELPPTSGCFGRGGNIVSMVSRKLYGPAEEWKMQSRIRSYRDARVFVHADEMQGFKGVIKGSESEVEKSMWETMGGLSKPFGDLKIEFIPFRCDGGTAGGMLVANPPPFMQYKVEKVEKK